MPRGAGARISTSTNSRFLKGSGSPTLAESLSVRRRQRQHLRVADAIEQAAASSEAQASNIAHHLYQAGSAADPRKTVRYLTLAGDQALEAGAFNEALRQIRWRAREARRG